MITTHQQRMKHKTVSNISLSSAVGRKTLLFLLWLNCEPEAKVHLSHTKTKRRFTFNVPGAVFRVAPCQRITFSFLFFQGSDSEDISVFEQGKTKARGSFAARV